MAENDKPTKLKISPDVCDTDQSKARPRLSELQRTLVKGSQWKNNTFERLQAKQKSNVSSDETSAVLDALKSALMDLVERNWRELVANAGLDTAETVPEKLPASESANDPAAVNQDDSQEEIGRLQKEVLSLVAKNTRLSVLHREERAAQQAEITKLKQKVAAQAARLQALMAKRQEQDKALSQLQTEQATSQTETLQLLDANASLRGELLRLKEEQGASQEELVRIRSQHDEQGRDLQDLRIERETLAAELTALQEAYEQFQLQSDEILSELETEVTRLRDQQGGD